MRRGSHHTEATRLKIARNRRSALRPRVARVLAVDERAWLGAFIEADGSAFLLAPRGGCIRRPTLMITQRIVEPVATALRVTQCGTVALLANGMWQWLVRTAADATAVAEQCAPYSWKIQRMLEEYRGADK